MKSISKVEVRQGMQQQSLLAGVQFIHPSEESFVNLMMHLSKSRAVIFQEIPVIPRDIKVALMKLKQTRQKQHNHPLQKARIKAYSKYVLSRLHLVQFCQNELESCQSEGLLQLVKFCTSLASKQQLLLSQVCTKQFTEKQVK